MPKYFPLTKRRTVEVVIGAGDTDILFEDSFDISEQLAGTLGPIQTQDTVDISDAPDVGPFSTQDSVATDDAAIVGLLDALALESLVVSDVVSETVGGPQFPDEFDTDDSPDIRPVFFESLIIGPDAAFIDSATITPLDSLAFADVVGEVTMDSIQLDSFDTDDKFDTDLVGGDSLTANDVVTVGTLTATEYAAATTATTGMTDPSNVLENDTNTFAECSAAASGLGGLTSNDTNFTMAVSMSDLDIDDFWSSWDDVDVHFEWSFATDGTALDANGGHDMDWEYSLDDGGVWTTLAANDHLNHGTLGIGTTDAKATTSFDLTGVLDSQTEFNQLRLRATGLVRSGTGLGRVSRLRFHRMWVTFTVEQPAPSGFGDGAFGDDAFGG